MHYTFGHKFCMRDARKRATEDKIVVCHKPSIEGHRLCPKFMNICTAKISTSTSLLFLVDNILSTPSSGLNVV